MCSITRPGSHFRSSLFPSLCFTDSLLYRKGEATPAKYDPTLNLETGEKAEAEFTLPEPSPAHLAAQVNLTSEYWHCGCRVLARTQDLRQKGIAGNVPEADSGHSTSLVKAEPNQILFFARPFSFSERLLYPFVKE